MIQQTREEIEEIFYKWKSIMILTKFYGPYNMNQKMALVLTKMLQEFFCKNGITYLQTHKYCEHVLISWGEFIIKKQLKLYSSESMQKFSQITMQSLGYE